MALYRKLDMWSIFDRLEKMMDYCYNGNEKDSPYWITIMTRSMNYVTLHQTCMWNCKI
ncbi:MAG: hypothetical protein K2N85_04525 [Lachnospiraceae bacterium]|nr:hypothetical protein [Lachnospiraceae bacterium]